MSDIRKWENLDFDCLVNIIGRVGVESLLLDVPFVCKSWHKATLCKSCWQHLDVPACLTSSRGRLPSTFERFLDRFVDEYHLERFPCDRFMNLLISRGFSKPVSLDLSLTDADNYLQNVVEKCPEVKSLSIGFYSNENISKFIGKWTQLQEVRLEAVIETPMFDEILAQIALNCKDFISLIVMEGTFAMHHAVSIAKHVPKIKNLIIKLCYIEQDELEFILGSCKELEYLDVSKCGYSLKWDEEKLKQLAKHIKTLNIAAFSAIGDCWHSDFEGVDTASEPDFEHERDAYESDADSYNGECSDSEDDRSAHETDFYYD